MQRLAGCHLHFNFENRLNQYLFHHSRALKQLNVIRSEQGLCKIFLHCDAAQAIGKIPVDVQQLEVDYLTVVGHKVMNTVILSQNTSCA